LFDDLFKISINSKKLHVDNVYLLLIKDVLVQQVLAADHQMWCYCYTIDRRAESADYGFHQHIALNII
jgi:hypothetical protein